MERISGESTIEIEFNVLNRPTYPLRRQAISDIEGTLRIRFGDKIVFDERDILLAEFAMCLYEWLTEVESDPELPFVYESMDYEETPILRIEVIGSNVSISSKWNEEIHIASDATNISSFVFSAKSFLTRFEAAIPGISTCFS
ncbi:MAG: hypothetical protein R2684_17280 [Pyrinomonadaceae bacterium]